jgi:hypothetical protein
MGLLLRLHTAILAWVIKFYRTRHTLKVFTAAHREELRTTPVYQWPLVMARQSGEIAAIKAGRLDAVGKVTDRKSWQWPFLPASVNRLSVPIIKSCYSADTEVLTRRGWILWPDVKDNDEFLTRGHDRKATLRYEKASRIVRQPYRGDMIHFEGNYVDILVTPEHRMFGRYRGERQDELLKHRVDHFCYSDPCFSKATSVAKYTKNSPGQYKFCIPTNGTWVGELPNSYDPRTGKIILSVPKDQPRKKGQWDVNIEPVTVDLKDWVAFLGIYIAEGSAHYVQAAKRVKGIRSKGNHSPYEVRISQQTTSEAYEDIGALLRRLPFAWEEQEKGFGVASRLLAAILGDYNTYDKHVPDWVKQLPPEYLEIFFEWACRGDGHHYESGSRSYWTVSKQLADDMVEIVVKLGRDVQASCKKQTGSKMWKLNAERQAPIYLVSEHMFYQPHAVSPYKSLTNWSVEKYDGQVYCCTVSSGVVMVRRAGKTAWCGQSPYNLRRMSRTPVPRRAINLIKGALIAQPWDIRPIENTAPIDNESEDDQKERVHIGKKVFTHPNHSDSFQTYMEQGTEDMCILGAFVGELRLTYDPERPLKMWPVNVESIRIFPAWSETTLDMPHYAQMTGLKGERGAVLFYDDEMLYIRDNPSTDNPFGLGKMEVAFMSVNSFLGIQDMSGRAGADQVHKTFLWWEQPQSDSAYQIVRRHIQNELEGQAKISIIGGMKKPEVVEVTPVTEEDLLLNWQELLIRMIANGFDMSAMALGVEHDINRAVGEVLDDKDFRSAVVPMAKRLQEAFTRKILHDKLGWYDLEFIFLNLDDPDAQTKIDMYARMYSCNSIVPNEIRRGMNLKPLDPETHPFAELTQFECMLINIQAMEDTQNNLADAGANRQLQVQQVQNRLNPPQPPQPAGPGQPPGKGPQTAPGSPKPAPQQAPQQPQQSKPQPITPGSVSRGGQPPSPKALALPKFPIASSANGKKYTAKKLQQLPLNEIADVWNFSQMPASQFLLAMDQQEPGILETLTQEVKEFFDQALEQEANKPRRKIPPALLKKWAKALGIKVRQQDKRTSDFGKWLYKLGQESGRPGGGSAKNSKAGIPGDINPIRRI